MSIRVEHPVLGIVELPDGTPPDQIEQILLRVGAITEPEGTSGGVFFNQLGEGIESSIEGISNLTGLGFYEDSYEDEFRNRVQLEQSPYAGYGGLLVGSILDPVTLPAAFLKPITLGSKVATGVARGGIVGAAGGGVEPVFEEFGDSRLLNTSVGAAFGGALGGALSKFIARDVVPPTKQEVDDGVDAALENVAEAVNGTPPTRTKTVDETRQEIEKELTAKSKTGITPATEKVLQKGIDERLKRVEQIEIAGAKRTKGLRAKDDKAAGEAALGRFEEIRKRLMGEVREMRLRIKKGQEGRAAGAELANLKTGQGNKLSPETQARLVAQEVQVEPPVVKTDTPQQPEVQVAQQVTQPVARATEDGAEEFAPLQMGFDPRTSAGSAGVRPEQRFAGQAAEGVDETELISSAWSRKNVEPAGDVGFELPKQDLKRAAQRQSAATDRLQNLMGHKFGRYTFAKNPAQEQEAIDLIGEDYDSLVDWLIDSARKNRIFNSAEQRILEPLRAEAEQRIAITYKAMRKMRAQGSFRSTTYTEDEYNAVMDLQFYSYIADIIDTNGTRLSHGLKEIQNIKTNRRRNAAKVKAGKPIDDIFGVKC